MANSAASKEASDTEGGATQPLSDRAREWVFRVLYAKSFTGKSAMQAVADVSRCFQMTDEEWQEAGNLSRYLPDPRGAQVSRSVWERNRDVVFEAARLIEDNLESIEAVIAKASPRWRLDRMPAVDRTLLVIGTYELLVAGVRPAKRSINRTVELAKRYGATDSRRFVTGILDQIRKDHDIPAA